MSETNDEIAERFGMSVEWVHLHIGRHRCVDDRTYIVSCLVTDPSCHRAAESYLRLRAEARA